MSRMNYDSDLGKKFGKHDVERLGIFSEMPYMVGVRYVAAVKGVETRKGATFLPTGRKSITGTQDGYFDKEFKRLYEGEAITRRKQPEKSTLTPFRLGTRSKKHSTPGDYYGTFNKVDAFSPALLPKQAYVAPQRNFTSKNSKKGGPGYADICINKFPEYVPDRYGSLPEYKSYGQQLSGPFVTMRYPKQYFDETPFKETDNGPAGPCYVVKNEKPEKGFIDGPWAPIGPTKWQGGCHGGCLNPFPLHEPCKYVSTFEANQPFITSKGPTFIPTFLNDKTMFTTSIVEHSADLRVNTTNYKTVEPVYIKHLVD